MKYGFTLIEVLVTLSVISIVFLGLHRALWAIGESQISLNHRLEAISVAESRANELSMIAHYYIDRPWQEPCGLFSCYFKMFVLPDPRFIKVQLLVKEQGSILVELYFLLKRL